MSTAVGGGRSSCRKAAGQAVQRLASARDGGPYLPADRITVDEIGRRPDTVDSRVGPIKRGGMPPVERVQ